MSSPDSTEGGDPATSHLEAADTCSSKPLRVCVKDAVEGYFRHLDGHDASDLFDMVMTEVEAPLLESVLAHVNGNQSRAAAILGINRTTLRKKLKRHGII